jgi:hypothetical protein
MRDPKLAVAAYVEDGRTYSIKVQGGLHMIRGNGKPYFSITADINRKCGNGRWVEDSGGCCHEEIEKRFPGKFSDLIALHLSDIDGVPMHGLANGWYFARGGQFFPGREWMPVDGPKYKVPATFEDRVNSLMRLFRIDRDFARKLVQLGEQSVEHERRMFDYNDTILRLHAQEMCYGQHLEEVPGRPVDFKQKERFTALVAELPARWKQEADACIARHGLVVYGDPYTPEKGGS